MTTESRELELLVKAAIQEVNKGNITLKDVLVALSPAQKSAEITVLPIPQQITQEQRVAVERVPEVFGQVIPVERRELTSAEVNSLIEEKETLDELKKMADSRMGNIRITVHNHMDIEAEKADLIDDESLRSDQGYYILGGKLRGTSDAPKQWSREVRQTSPSLDTASLRALEDDPDVDFDHDDFLAMTTQIRMVDEHKVMMALKKNPQLVMALHAAVQPGSKSASLYLRKAGGA